MPRSITLSLEQIVSLTDEALLVVDAGSQTLRFASPRALDLLDVPGDVNPGRPLADFLDPGDGRLNRFLADAATVSSPVITRLQRLSDGARLTAKGRRVTGSDRQALIIVAFKAETELSRRFRLLADKISALNFEIEQRKNVEAQLSRNATARERTLVAVRGISEINTNDPAYLFHALDVLRAACDCPGAAVIGTEAGRLMVRAASGQLASSLDLNAPLDTVVRQSELWEMTEPNRIQTVRAALGKSARVSCDLTDLEVWPLFAGTAVKSWLVLQGLSGDRNDSEIVSEALASLVSRVSVEEDLRHAQKLQAIGELTGGIAHDFNNILAVILGNAELVLDKVAQFGPASVEIEFASAIRDAAIRGATLTSRLLSFARKQPLHPQSLSLNTVLRDLDSLLRRSLGESINIEIVGAGGLWKTCVDLGQFDNAVLNLAVNARDAMPDGGSLTIETANTRLDAEYAAEHSEVTPGQYVMVAVTDTGTGMTPDVMREAFIPFFTTKGVGQGSGLGLSMVFGFVKQSGGHVKIYSELGQGTTVKMYFPRDLTDVPTGSGEEPVAPSRKGSANGLVLLVEDDPAILRYTKRTLSLLGYSVDAALTGDAAADLLRQRVYDILLTDVVLPGRLNGVRLADLAHKLRPGIKVLFMSGYTENAIVHNGRLDPNVELISKPFTRDQLARRLQNLTKS